jgi:hypothetical protein
MLIILFLDIGTSTSSPSASAPSTSKSGAKIGIGVGIALVVVLLALGLGWFIVMHRRKRRRENNDGSFLEHVPTIHEIGYTSNPLEKPSLTPISTTREIDGTEVQTRNELDSDARPQSTELGTGAENRPQESSSPALRSHIQQKPVSLEHSSFPPPWATSLYQGNDERQEQFGIGQSQQETINTKADEMVIEPDDQDPELLRLEEEMAKVKAEGERLQRLQYLENKERELKKTIEERRKGSVGASNS